MTPHALVMEHDMLTLVKGGCWMFVFGLHRLMTVLCRGQQVSAWGVTRICNSLVRTDPRLPPLPMLLACVLAGIERCQWTPDGTHVILIAAFRIRIAIWSLLEQVCT